MLANPLIKNAKTMPVASVDILVLDDDTEAVALLLEAGVLAHIAPTPPHNRGMAFFLWNGYYGIGVCFKGYELPEDNGYEVFLMPTATVDKETALAIASFIIDSDELTNIESKEISLIPNN